MIMKDLYYSEKDITNVYAAIMSVNPDDIANGLFSNAVLTSSGCGSFIEERVKAASSRIKSIMKLIGSLQPDFDFSVKDPLKPWSISEAKEIQGVSWPKVLGMRVIMPAQASKDQKACMVSNLLANMACIK